jgi:hypothetical protein
MNAETITKKADLLAHIERDWQAINALFDSLSVAQLTTIRNPDGWTIKDHIAHLTAWENSVVYFFQGQPRHAGLGIAEAIYLAADIDATNAVIFQAHRDDPLAAVLERFKTVHAQVMSLLEPLTDEDLAQPYVHYLPYEPGEGAGPPAMNVVYGNTSNHYREHHAWIEQMLKA